MKEYEMPLTWAATSKSITATSNTLQVTKTQVLCEIGITCTTIAGTVQKVLIGFGLP